MAHGLANTGDSCIDEVLRSPDWLGSADLYSEIPQDVDTGLSVAHFGMELYGPHLFLRIFDGGDSVGRTGSQAKAGGQFHRFVAVRHPHGKLFRQPAK